MKPICAMCEAEKRDADWLTASVSPGPPARITLFPYNSRDGGYALCGMDCARSLLKWYQRRVA